MADHILVVDDEDSLRTVLGTLLRRQGYDVTVVEDGVIALETIQANEFSAILTDLKMPNMDGMALLRNVAERWPDLPVIMLTAHGTVDTAVEALKVGAFDFVSKGCDNDEIAKVVAKAVATRTLSQARPRTVLEPDEADVRGRFGLIGVSPTMQAVFNIVAKVADTPSTVLVTGESGTGKELIAKALHSNSSRQSRPFIRVNCAAIPDTLIESELFGYEKGAFTGATTSKPGRFELADGGTLFLDEIGEISTEMQVKLLRAIQESEFERVGGIKTKRVDVRLVTATNRDLAAEVSKGQFREDLFYRLNVVPVQLPALRDRHEDIPLLVEHILEKYCRRLGQPLKSISSEALLALSRYPWPGNIRELENLLERTLLFSEGEELGLDDLPGEFAEQSALTLDGISAQIPSGVSDLKEAVKMITRRIEREMIERALLETEGNVTRASRNLGISRKSLQTKMKDLELRANGSSAASLDN